MRIGIEAQRLFRPHKHGMDRVALELIKTLQSIDKENEYFIFVKPDKDNQVISNTENFKIVEVEGSIYPIWEQVKLPKMAQTYNCDVLHCTSNTAPLALKIPIITTLHDIIFKEENIVKQFLGRASWYQKFGNLYRRLLLDYVVKNSKQLITVSNFERENIINHFDLDGTKIRTIHNGVNENFKAHFEYKQKEEVSLKYQLPQRFLLHFANTDPRKNTARVLKAFSNYVSTTSDDIKLVLVGINEINLDTIVCEIDLEKEIINEIVLTGYVEDKDLPVLYNLSEAFLFPSLREGFGIPIIEAMACGVPVITSNSSSMPEVAGKEACLVNPFSTDNITKAINKVLTEEEYSKQLIKYGLSRYTAFSWLRSASDVLDIYKQFNKKNTD